MLKLGQSWAKWDSQPRCPRGPIPFLCPGRSRRGRGLLSSEAFLPFLWFSPSPCLGHPPSQNHASAERNPLFQLPPQVPQGHQVSSTSPVSPCVCGDALGATGWMGGGGQGEALYSSFSHGLPVAWQLLQGRKLLFVWFTDVPSLDN